MGTDISAHIEFYLSKYDDRKRWEYYGEILIPRSYHLFGLMAGVRGEQTLFKAKGLPEDVCTCLIEDYEECEGYSASYLFQHELLKVIEIYWELNANWPEMKLILDATTSAMGVLNNGSSNNSRLVFWFV